MKPAVLGVLKSEPSLLGGLIVAGVAVIAIALPTALGAALTAFAAILASIVVRSLVWSANSVTKAVTETAVKTADAVVNTVDAVSAGVEGITTAAGQVVADAAINGVVADVLGSTLAVPQRGHKK